MRLLRPGSLEEALAALGGTEGPVPIAGGTRLVPALAGDRRPAALLDLAGIAELRRLEAEEPGDGWLRIGAGVTLAQLAAAPETARWPALGESIAAIGGAQIRNQATVGGSVAIGIDPGDLIPPLLLAGAELELAQPPLDGAGESGGGRRRPLAELLDGGRLRIGRSLIAAVLLPPRPAPDGVSETFVKHGERRAAIGTLASLALAVDRGNGEVRVALGLGAARPGTELRLPVAEAPSLRDRVAALAAADPGGGALAVLADRALRRCWG